MHYTPKSKNSNKNPVHYTSKSSNRLGILQELGRCFTLTMHWGHAHRGIVHFTSYSDDRRYNLQVIQTIDVTIYKLLRRSTLQFTSYSDDVTIYKLLRRSTLQFISYSDDVTIYKLLRRSTFGSLTFLFYLSALFL
jgi:hypothetical protein